jgi:hypothetical protein
MQLGGGLAERKKNIYIERAKETEKERMKERKNKRKKNPEQTSW